MITAAIFIILGIIALYLFCICPRLTRKKDTAPFRHTRFAHRGYHNAAKLIPENSMAAFRAAVAKGYGIELDIHLTKDGQLVVFHDDTLERICQTPGTIESFTFRELREFHLLGTSERIPLFSEVLSYVDGRVPLLIELKIPARASAICEMAYRMLASYKGPYLIQSFNTMGLFWFRLHAPEVLRGQLSSNLTGDKLKESYLLRFFAEHLLANVLGRPDFISYKLKDLPKLAVFFCHRLYRVPIAVWTLRSPQALQIGQRDYDIQIFEKSGENY